MNKIRLLIVDDAAFIRQVLSRLLSEDPELEVVATAINGRMALSKLADVQPDAVILDVEMPEMNGLETLAAIRKLDTRLPVIMFSSLTRPGVRATVDALLLGASDYAAKPERPDQVEHCIRQTLIPKIKLHAAVGRGGSGTAIPQGGREQPSPPARVGAADRPGKPQPAGEKASSPAGEHAHEPVTRPPVDVIAIAASTGGPTALARLFADLPGDLPVPILVVQHMPPNFTSHLAYRLSSKGNVIIREASTGDLLTGARGWIAPGDYHLVVERSGDAARVRLNQDPPVNACRPSADVLLKSVAEVYGDRTLAIVLTGMGQDGCRGCEIVKSRGGQVLVQDEASSVVWGMPGAVARAGLADLILPIERIGAETFRRVRAGRAS